MNPHLSQDMITPDTVLIAKHAGWAAAQAGKKAWIIDDDDDDDDDDDEQNEFAYNCNTINTMRYVRKNRCEALRKGNTL